MKPEEKEKNINPIYTYPTKMYLLGYKFSFVQHDDFHYASIEITRLDNNQKISLDEFSSSVASLRYKSEQENLLPIQKTLFSVEHLRYVAFDVLYLKTEPLDFISFVLNIVCKKKDGSYNLISKNKTSNVFIIKTEELWNLPSKTFTYLNENKGHTGCLLLDSLKEKEYETAMKIIHSSLLKKVYQTDINGITELGYILDNANKLVKRD